MGTKSKGGSNSKESDLGQGGKGALWGTWNFEERKNKRGSPQGLRGVGDA